MKFKLKLNLFTTVILILASAIALEGAALYFGNQNNNSTLQEYARKAIEICAQENHRPSCYDREIPNFMEEISMEEAFQVAAMVQTEDDAYNYCHVLGHNLSAKEASVDPSSWAEVISRCPTGICSNGCLHGAAQERFSGEVLTDDQLETAKLELQGVCDDKPTKQLTGLERSECFHGLGHLTMYITGAEMTKSLTICEDIAYSKDGNSYTSLCFEGAFMQLFQPLDEDDITLVSGKVPTKDKLFDYCNQFTNTSWSKACWAEGFPLFRDDISKASGVEAYCGKAKSDAREHCYRMLFYARAQGLNYDSIKLAEFCKGFNSQLSGECFGHIANAMIHGGNHLIDRATSFCANGNNGQKDACYQIILEFADYNLPVYGENYIRLCNNLGDQYKNQCLQKRI